MTMHGYTDRGVDYYTYHPFDIETDGLRATDAITALTLKDEETYVVFCRTRDGEPAEPATLESRVETVTGKPIDLHPCATQADILAACNTYVQDNFSIERDIITAYNGECYTGGGFDLKVLRTAAIRERMPEQFPFRNYAFTDIYDIVSERDRIHTDMPQPPSKRGTAKDDYVALAEMVGVDTSGVKDDVVRRVRNADPDPDTVVAWAEAYNDGEVPLSSENDLNRVFELLTGQTVDYDAFDDSAEAVAAFEAGNLAQVVIHNVADVYQTAVLTDFVTQTVPQSELKPKYL